MDDIKRNISIIIPTYNGVNLLTWLLPKLYLIVNESKSIQEYEIIIVDDASSDNTKEFILNNYPQIFYIKNLSNKGFSKTVNIGILKSKYDLVFLNILSDLTWIFS